MAVINPERLTDPKPAAAPPKHSPKAPAARKDAARTSTVHVTSNSDGKAQMSIRGGSPRALRTSVAGYVPGTADVQASTLQLASDVPALDTAARYEVARNVTESPDYTRDGAMLACFLSDVMVNVGWHVSAHSSLYCCGKNSKSAFGAGGGGGAEFLGFCVNI